MADDCGNCPDHTGQEEKIKAVGDKMSLLIILMLLQLGGTGFFYNQVTTQTSLINKLTTDVVLTAKRVEMLEAGRQQMQASAEECRKRVEALERDAKR